jgi:nitrogen fixation/metabolism regulation signal transduction histidine kinase
MRRYPWGLLGMVLLFLLLLASLVVMGDAAQNSARFEQMFLWLLAFHGLVLLVLGTLIVYQFVRLIAQYRKGVPGSRLTLRLVAGFMLVAVLPVTVVYYFSFRFLNEGVDSWFDVRVDGALEDALELSRSSLDLRVSSSRARRRRS